MTELTAGDLGSSVPRRGTRFSRWLGRRLLAALGLRITGHMPNFPKMMVIGAPHTSNWDGVMAIGMALALSILATIYPSWRASTLDPVEALRYE